MDTQVPTLSSGHNGATPNHPIAGCRRVLVVTDPSAASYEHQEKLSFTPHLSAFHVDYRDVQSLGLDQRSSATRLAQMTGGTWDDDLMANFSMLGKYQLILVPNERIRAMLCEAMPGLANHVYALDCFGQAGCRENPSQRGSSRHTAQLDTELDHWSTFLSHLSC